MAKRKDFSAWKDGDRISDRIVDLANEELARGTPPLQVFAGEMLALLSLTRTAEGLLKPAPMIAVEQAVTACLHSMIDDEWKP